MNLSKTGMAYRRSAIEGASPIGLIIVLFDTLAGDLRRAAAAIQHNDIEARCKEMNHADLVIARLESWIDRKNGGESAEILSRLYTSIKAKMVAAAATKSAELLDAQADMILQIRAAWQLLDAPLLQPLGSTGRNSEVQIGAVYGSEVKTAPERDQFSQSV